MTPLALQFALNGAIALLSGLIGGLFFARSIKLRRGSPFNRLVAGLYGIGTVVTLAGCVLLVIGLFRSVMIEA